MQKRSGISLEEQVYDAITRMINDGQLFKPTQCKVFLHKKYYSKEREDYIETDVSIEVFIGNATEPFFVWIWECKNYNDTISVDQVEEFHAKLEQIGDDNTKGTMITSDGCFQRGSIQYARSKKIGIARLLPDGQVEHIMYYMTPDMLRNMFSPNNYLSALTQKSYRAKNQSAFIYDHERKFSSLEEYVLRTIEKIKH